MDWDDMDTSDTSDSETDLEDFGYDNIQRRQLLAVVAAAIAVLAVEANHQDDSDQEDTPPYFPFQDRSPRCAEHMREYLTDTLWTELFVFTKDEFFTLLPLLQLPPNFHVENNGVPCESGLAVLMLLASLSAPRSLSPDLVHWFLQDRTRISAAIDAATNHLFLHFNHTLALDSERLGQDKQRYAASVANQLGLDATQGTRGGRIALFADSFLLPVANDTINAHEDFFDKTRQRAGLRFYLVTSPCGLIEDCTGPFPGGVTDRHMADKAQLPARLKAFMSTPTGRAPRPTHFRVCSASPCPSSVFVTVPSSKQAPPPPLATVHSKASALGQHVRQTFPAIEQHEAVARFFFVTVMLHNMLTCLRGTNQVSHFFGVPPPPIHTFLRPRNEVNPHVQYVMAQGARQGTN